MIAAALRWLLASPTRAIAAALILIVLGLVARTELLGRQLDRARAEIRELRIDSLNLEARHDTTRQLFRDSLAGVERLVEQLQVESHARLVRGDREAQARADLALQVKVLKGLVTAGGPAVEDTAGLRTAAVALDSTPFHVRAEIALPPPPAPAIARWDSLWVDPALLTLQLDCEGPAAVASVVGPPWLDVDLVQVQQDPRFCNPPQPSAQARWVGWDLLEGGAIGAGAGVVVDGGRGAALGAPTGALLRLGLRALGL